MPIAPEELMRCAILGLLPRCARCKYYNNEPHIAHFKSCEKKHTGDISKNPGYKKDETRSICDLFELNINDLQERIP